MSADIELGIYHSERAGRKKPHASSKVDLAMATRDQLIR